MRRIAVLGLLAAFGGACFEDTAPVGETGAAHSSGDECIAGTEGCPCIDGACVGELECLSSVCVDAGSTSAASADGSTSSATSSATSSNTVTSTPPLDEGPLDEGPLDEGPVTTSMGGGLPQGAPCDPFFDQCEMTLACVGLDMAGLVCDAPGPGTQYEACDQEACGPGLLCMQASAVGGMCQSMVACCSAMCDLSGEGLCPTGLVCEPFYPLMSAPPGYEHIGVCVAP